MSDHNGTNQVGRLVKDPQFYPAGRRGNEHCTGTLAVNRVVPNEQGPGADFIPFSIWGPEAKVFCEGRAKGDTVMIRGRIRTSLVDGPGAKKIPFWEVRVDHFQFGQQSRKNMQPKPNQDSATDALGVLTQEFKS